MQNYGVELTLTCVLLLSFSYLSNGNLEKFIAKPYFEKHDILIDSKFEEFTLHKLPLDSCKILENNPKILNLNRRLIGEGSHRILSSSIKINVGSVSKSCSWEVIIIEKLPSGVFSDPFELQHLVQQNVYDDACVFGDTNLELPSFKSNRSLVELHKKIDYNYNYKDELNININVNLPLHVRYPALGQGFARIEFGVPDLFVGYDCKGGGTHERCLVLDDKGEFRGVDIVWEVPTGIKEHARIVSVVTFFSAFLSAFLIVFTSIYCESKQW